MTLKEWTLVFAVWLNLKKFPEPSHGSRQLRKIGGRIQPFESPRSELMRRSCARLSVQFKTGMTASVHVCTSGFYYISWYISLETRQPSVWSSLPLYLCVRRTPSRWPPTADGTSFLSAHVPSDQQGTDHNIPKLYIKVSNILPPVCCSCSDQSRFVTALRSGHPLSHILYYNLIVVSITETIGVWFHIGYNFRFVWRGHVSCVHRFTPMRVTNIRYIYFYLHTCLGTAGTW